MKEALFYEKKDNNIVQCRLCPNNCTISPGNRGNCKVRQNQNGQLVSLAYGKLISAAIDPIEKKPLFHFLPGSMVFSVATAGCNLHCLWCQNYKISQSSSDEIPFEETKPIQIVRDAKDSDCTSIAYTYVEPSIFYEYVLDIAKLAREHNLKNIMVTNGYINPAPLKQLYQYIDGANIDIKAFTEDTYNKYCKGKLAPVLEATKLIKEMNIHIEITNLLIPGVNDDPNMIKEMCTWIVDNLGKETPIHFSRFFPTYKMTDTQPTPIETLEKAYQIAKEAGLVYIYLGNTQEHSSTYCPNCKQEVIKRSAHYELLQNNIKERKCGFCGGVIHGIFDN